MRQLLKTGLALGLTAAGNHRMIRWAGRTHRAPLLTCYHRVRPEAPEEWHVIPSMLLSVQQFERQLDWLEEHYRIVALDEIGAVEGRANGNGSKPAAAITFDDGYRDIYEYAFPILRRRGIPAGLFLITDLVGTGRVPLHDRLYVLVSALWRKERKPPLALRRVLDDEGIPPPRVRGWDVDALEVTRALLVQLEQHALRALLDALADRVRVDEAVWDNFRMLDWEMVEEMRAAGFTVGSHTRTHPTLPREPDDVLEEEIAGSRRVLERRLGAPAHTFAYPDGRFDARVVRAVARAGYRYAFNTCRHRHAGLPHLTIRRKTLWENCCRDARGRFSPAVASCQMAGIFDWFNPCEQDHEGDGRDHQGDGPERQGDRRDHQSDGRDHPRGERRVGDNPGAAEAGEDAGWTR